LNPALAGMTRHYFEREAMFVTPATDIGLTVRYDNPNEVGADRVVNGAAAFHKYGGPCIIVDLGTAITFDIVSARAEYLGGIICPGIGISIDALFQRTARLPKVDFRAPEKLIGTNTVGSIQSGIYWGAISMIDGIVERLLAELGPDTKTVATGGQASLIQKGSRYLKAVDENLTLAGLELIWRRNRK
jgi:type III pantothenate kinase